MGNLPNSLDNEILELCKQGKKLSAIKLLCETTGMGLKESKDYVDRISLKTRGGFD
jgi:ribosomal protein L7/L12